MCTVCCVSCVVFDVYNHINHMCVEGRMVPTIGGVVVCQEFEETLRLACAEEAVLVQQRAEARQAKAKRAANSLVEKKRKAQEQLDRQFGKVAKSSSDDIEHL